MSTNKKINAMPFDLWLFDWCQDLGSDHDHKIVWSGPEYDFFCQPENIKQLIDQEDVVCVVHCRFSGPVEDQQAEFLQWLSDFYRNTNKNTKLIYIHNDDHPMFRGIEKIHFLYFPEYLAYYYPLYSGFQIQHTVLEKKFLCLNKRGSPHRRLIYQGFYNHDLLDDSYFSYLGQSDYLGSLNDSAHDERVKIQVHRWIEHSWAEAEQWQEPPERFRWLDNKDRAFFHSDEWRSWQGFGSGEIEATWQQDCLYYTKSFCSVVIETSPMAKRINFSEKTVRAIGLGHPFVLIATKNSVQFLRDHGFDMFDDIIDHSYDSIDDDLERFKQAWASIQQIAKLSLTDLQEISDHIIPRRQHNIQQLQAMYYRMFDREYELVDSVADILGIEVLKPLSNPYKILGI